MPLAEFLLVEFDPPFDKGDAFGHYSVVDHSDFASGGLHSMEKALLGLHASEECRKSGMLAGGNREGSFTKDLSGTGVLFEFLPFIGFAGLMHRGSQGSP